MLIDQYYSESYGKVTFSRQQASNFAKKMADDFNPLHDEDAKKFCVPGDLLFSMMLSKYGVSEHMTFNFSGMVRDTTSLTLPTPAPQFSLNDDSGKQYLSVEREGAISKASVLIDNLTHSYVSFSGMTFPHLLVLLLKEKGVMINPERPLVMYQSMVIDLQRLDLTQVELQLDKEKTIMDVNGKRGNALLSFNLLTHGELVGRGEKHMVLSGLKEFEQNAVNELVGDYAQRKKQFRGE